jgi:RNA polymerase I-specific transcription initiation factor RRN3
MELPKCEFPPPETYALTERAVAQAVQEQHTRAQNRQPGLGVAYRGIIDTLKSTEDLEMIRMILLALRTSGKGRTLTYLTQSATTHASLIHLVLRLNPYELQKPKKKGKIPRTANSPVGATATVVTDYAMADAQLHLLMAIVSANSIFLVPTMTSLWKMLTFKLADAPSERYV